MSNKSVETPGPKARRFQRYLLIGSLAVNFLVVGVLVGGAFTDHSRKLRPPQGDVEIGAFTRALGEDQKREMQQDLREKIVKRSREDRQQAREMLLGLIAAIRAEPYEVEQVEFYFNGLSALGTARRTQGEAALIDAISNMTPDERKSYSERLEMQLKKRKPSEKKPARSDG